MFSTQKKRSSPFIRYFLLTSFVCGALSQQDLFATPCSPQQVAVTPDTGAGALGTLSGAINVTNTPSPVPCPSIQILSDASPMSITGNMPTITQPVTIDSNNSSNRTINCPDAFTIATTGVVFTSNITFSLLETLNINANSSLTINGPIQSASTILMNGATLILSGNLGTSSSNSINLIQLNTGSTTISGNVNNVTTIQINGATSVLNISGDISSNAASGYNFNIYNGATTLSGNNSDYLGAITLYGGSLQISNINGIGPGIINFSGGTFKPTSTVTFGIDQQAILTNSATFDVSATGASLTIPILEISTALPSVTLTLAGTDTNSVSIAEFSFNPQIVTGGSYASVNINVDGILSGGNGLFLTNPTAPFLTGTPRLTLTLLKPNTYIGSTSVADYCTLQVGPTVATPTVKSTAAFGTSSNTVTVGLSSSDTHAILNNYGSIVASTVTNYGTTNLYNLSTVTCTTFTNNGLLTGCGTITGTLNNSGTGTLTTGCSPSALIIIGNSTFETGSTFSPYLDPSGIASLIVTGNLTIDSGVILDITPEPGCYTNGQQFELITVEGTFSGTFSTVDVGSLFFPIISYGPNGARLTIQRNNLEDLVQGYNAQQVGHTLDILLREEAGSGDSTFCSVIGDLVLLSPDDISSILNEMQPALFKGLAISQESSMIRVQESLNNRLQTVLSEQHCLAIPPKKGQEKPKTCSKEKKPFHAWVAGIGNALHQGSTYYAGSPQIGYHDNMGGAVAAIDAFFAKCLYAGVLGAYTSTDVKWNNGQGKGNIQSGYAGTYFSAIGDLFYGNASVIGSLNSYESSRKIFLPSNTLTAKNNHGGPQLLSHLDTGINLGWGWFSLKPFDSFDYIAQKERGFTERGAGALDLSVKKSNAILIRNELGLNFAGCFCTSGSKWVISPKISWVREVRVKGSSYTAEFKDTDVPFTVIGYFPDRSLVSPGVNVTGTMLEDRLTLTAYYNGEIRGNYNNHSYGGEVRFGF